MDRKLLPKLSVIRWKLVPGTHRIRGTLTKDKTRQYLHRYVLTLNRLYFPEVSFANGDWWDCRLVNLKPYDREEDGARRRRFKTAKNQKGVSFHKRVGKWTAMIRIHKKLHHLGYFKSAEKAADAYAKAWNNAHPDKPHIPLQSSR